MGTICNRQIYIKVSRLFCSLVICGTIGAITGCSEKHEKEKVILTHVTPQVSEMLHILEEVIGEFEKENPEIRINLISAPGRHHSAKLKTMLGGGTPPDTTEIRNLEFPAFAERGIFVDLGPYIKQEDENFMDDFSSISVDLATHIGKIYGFTYGVECLFLFYNKDLFDRAGVNYPDETWTWDTMLEAAKKLTQEDRFGIWPPSSQVEGFIPFVWQNGGNIFDDVENPKQCFVNRTEAVEAIQFLVDMRHKYHCAPTASQGADQGPAEMFMSERIAMKPDGSWQVPNFCDLKFKWDVAILPKKECRATWAGSSCFSILKGSKHYDESYKFIKFLTNTASQKKFAKTGFAIPTRESALGTYLNPDAPPANQLILLERRDARMLPKTCRYEEIATIFEQELALVFLQDKSVQDACDRIVPRVEAILREK